MNKNDKILLGYCILINGITNKELLNDLEMVYKQVNPRKGILLSYITNNTDKKGKKNNRLEIDEYFGEDAYGKEQLMELIYFPKFLSTVERQEVETYLSLKYGTSIVGEFDYIDSEGEKVWEYKKNAPFNSRVTGIGRDDRYSLYQKQSTNAEKDGLAIGLDSVYITNNINKSLLADRSFLIWGDNNGTVNLQPRKDNKEMGIMKRVWKMQTSITTNPEKISTQVRLCKKDLGYTNTAPGKLFLWLVIDRNCSDKFDYTGATNYLQSSEDGQYIYFDGIIWDEDNSGSDTFTLVQGPGFFFNPEALASCGTTSQGSIKLNISGGEGPFDITLKALLSEKTEQIYTTANNYEFTGLVSGEYSINITDKYGMVQSQNVMLDPFGPLGLSLAPVWHIDNTGIAKVKPSVSEDINLTFEWKKAGQVISNESVLMHNEPGDFILVAKTTSGCSKELPFVILENNTSDQSEWTVYPNPTERSAPFSIRFNLARQAEARLSITTMDGKAVIEKTLGLVQYEEFREALINSGVYMITVTLDGVPETAKLIVH